MANAITESRDRDLTVVTASLDTAAGAQTTNKYYGVIRQIVISNSGSVSTTLTLKDEASNLDFLAKLAAAAAPPTSAAHSLFGPDKLDGGIHVSGKLTFTPATFSSNTIVVTCYIERGRGVRRISGARA
jgi:hypothetical protein